MEAHFIDQAATSATRRNTAARTLQSEKDDNESHVWVIGYSLCILIGVVDYITLNQ
jgi:hypothetical protein